MDVVQWLVPGRGGAAGADVGVCFAPAWADRLPAVGRQPALRRRSAPLVSRHLSRPLAVAVPLNDIDDDEPTGLPDAPGAVTVRFALSVDGEPLLAPNADDVRFAAVLGEFVGVVIDLCEAAGIPVMGAVPVDERRALDVLVGGLRGQSRARLADALLLLAAAVQTAALARGFSTMALLMVPSTAGTSGVIAVDGCIEAAL
jgi:hypothetical protein